jgi:peptide/nickel transport system substrate-binding protein
VKSRPFRIGLMAAVIALGPFGLPGPGPALASASQVSTTIPLLRIGELYPISSLDPTKNLNTDEANVFTLDTLLRLGPDNQLGPGLATSVTEPNPTTYIYHLRQGVKFWDGTALTAADVAYSLDYEGAPANVAAFGKFADFKSATATGPYTVVVRLTQPNAAWQYTAAFPQAGIFEKAFAVAHKGTFGNSQVLIMGSGPWEVKSFDPTTGVTLAANPDWWGGKVNIDKITITFLSSETSLALAMRAGEIDLDPFVGSPRTFGPTSGAQLLTSPSCSVSFFSMNVHQAPWSDVHVRRAVAYALNRTAIIAAGGGYSQPNYSFIPGSQLDGIATASQIDQLLASIPHYDYNLTKAKQEMAESPYPKGFTYSMLDYQYGSSIDVIQVIDAELQQIGINITPKIVPLDAWLANVGTSRQRAVDHLQHRRRLRQSGC